MKTKYYLIFLAMLLSFGPSNKTFAQRCLVMRYDADGNRISRTVTTNCQNMREMTNVQAPVVEEANIVVYPNPNNGCFRVMIPDSLKKEKSYYELFDMNGVVLIENKLYDNQTEIDIGIYPAGVYLLKLFNGEDVILKIVLKQ